MIRSITVTNFLGESLKMELANPYKSGLIIKSIDGLGPSKATINAKELATADGSIFNSARLSARNIVIKLQFLGTPTIEDTRQMTYRYFPVKKKVSLLIETDNRIAKIDGYVEQNDPDIFSKNEGANISIVCPDPYFYSAGPDGTNITNFFGVDDNFEFPFSNESLEEDLLELGIVKYSTERVIYYTGDADIGMVIVITAHGNVDNLTIYDVRTRNYIRILTEKLVKLTGNGIIQGDEITISTLKNDKYISLLRNGETINILNALDRGTTWLQLSHGDNRIAYSADDGGSNLQFRIENKTLFEGV